MIVGTAGHIDHGKTALVKQLTGVDADRLAEEKSRGITIDLGYAYTPLTSGEILGFVDVPGHEKFIHNMLAGATGIDFALLVVAADDGPMPQTVEHLQIIDLLGIEQGAVALTKTDLVDAGRIAAARGAIEASLTGTRLAGCPVFEVSAHTGAGVAELRAHLELAAARLDARVPGGGFRLAVDRSFTVAGIGTVVTGTVFSGTVRSGDHLLLAPSGLKVRIRGIHAQNRPAESGQTGQRCALNLAGVEKQEVQRGDWVLAPALHRPTRRLDVRLRLLGSEAKPLRHWTPLHVHLGAFRSAGHVALLEADTLEPGAGAWAQLVLDQPTCAAWGDRCILRDGSAQRTLAGGTVLDTQPPARGRRSPQRRAILAAWEQDLPETRLRALLDSAPNGVDLGEFAANANLTEAETDRLCASLELKKIDGASPLAFAPAHWAELSTGVIAALQQEHQNVPDSLGLNTEQLRLRTAPRMERHAFGALLAELLADGQCRRDGSWWHLPGHELSLAPEDEALWNRLAPLLTAEPFQPPRVRDIARAENLDETAVRRLLMRAARLGQVYRIAHDHYFDRTAVARLAAIVRQTAGDSPDGAVLAAEFRNRIGTGRKLAIHILEFFDRIGLTRRIKDSHRLRNETLEF
ncbi:selenocysteine-specific translation elongation factor [Methylococcus sp. Mc7]|uniref:selenocysteine-specific translation elongation factor n=1 Tax=Methylococcus sp. Mc7 TaxID=2860258 RepID=UPI001C52D0CA|nr:selenocysteine-specific translation elongation factor [Methylococcus sp. Mc7]QXP82861.1 selenocysteine-specific translation elongation factor [Methylococcus sp. Mc7]